MDSVFYLANTFLAVEKHGKETCPVFNLYCPFEEESDEEQEKHFSVAVIASKFLKINADEFLEHKSKFIFVLSYFHFYSQIPYKTYECYTVQFVFNISSICCFNAFIPPIC